MTLDYSIHKNIQLQILKEIYTDTSIAPHLGFKGGTATLMFYDLNRYSVDLDFDLLDEGKGKEVFEKILKEVSFVDKIIFGKLNYNVTSSQFGVNGDFYHDCANKVIEFCKNNGIEYHIKYGTQKKDNRKTERIFIKNTAQGLGSRYAKQPALSL